MLKKLTLLASDLAAFYAALAAVLLVRYGTEQWHIQWAIHSAPFSILLLMWLLVFYIANLYDQRILRNDRDFFERLAQTVAAASIASVIFFYLIPYFGIAPKTNLFLFLIALALLTSGTRFLYNRVIAGGTKKRLLIVGINQESIDLARLVNDNPQLGYRVCALVRLGQEPLPLAHSISPWPVIDDLSGVSQFIANKHIDTVVISPVAYQMTEVVGMFYDALLRRVNFTDLASLTERLTGRVPLGAINQIWFLDNITEGSKKTFDAVKRAADVVAAVVLGIPSILIAPIIAILIKLESPGPVLFRQQRSGRGGIPFNIIKFRSMQADAESRTGAVWTKENDPRITRIGRILRKSRIDELPQLWNILRGDMSLVGPRAERPEFDAQLTQKIQFYRERYLVKPGLSGWAQINYSYGASLQDAIQKLQYDLYYIKHRSFVLDLEIILKTINISLRRVGR